MNTPTDTQATEWVAVHRESPITRAMRVGSGILAWALMLHGIGGALVSLWIWAIAHHHWTPTLHRLAFTYTAMSLWIFAAGLLQRPKPGTALILLTLAFPVATYATNYCMSPTWLPLQFFPPPDDIVSFSSPIQNIAVVIASLLCWLATKWEAHRQSESAQAGED